MSLLFSLVGLFSWDQNTRKKSTVNNFIGLALYFLSHMIPIISTGEMHMRKESRVVLTEEQHAVLTYAAEMEGMALATYLRHCALNAAASIGIRAKQPRVD
jgi:hypothetical protein